MCLHLHLLLLPGYEGAGRGLAGDEGDVGLAGG